jgi:hypothetical protein
VRRLRGLTEMLDRLPFKQIVAVDFEFNFGGDNAVGERPRP